MKRLSIPALALALALPFAAHAQDFPAPAKVEVIYKLIARDGRVTYTQSAPKDFPGRVVKIEIDPRANQVVFPRPNERPQFLQPRALTPQEARRLETENDRVKAQDALDEAKKALKDGQEPREGELNWIGNRGGGARPVPTEAFQNRIKALEDAVKAAEENLDRARRAARQAAID
jgi:predicted RNA-binding protein